MEHNINEQILSASILAASDAASEFDLITIADTGDAPEFASDLADTFLYQLTYNRPHIKEHENYEDFKTSLADSLLHDASNALYVALNPSLVEENQKRFAINAAATIESEMTSFGISLDAEEIDS